MPDQTNDTQQKINEEDRRIQQRQHSDQGEKADDFQGGSSGMPGGGEAEGRFARQSESAAGRTLGGTPNELTARPSASNPLTGAGGGQPGGTDRSTPGGSMSGTTGEMTSGAPGGQGVGSVGTIGGTERDTSGQSGGTEYGAQSAGSSQGTAGEQVERSGEPLGASHQHSADGGSVTAAGAGSTGPGAGQAGTDRSEGFIGSGGDDRDPQQAGFAERGRGAPGEGRDIERGGERTANRSTDVEGSSDR